MSDIWIFIQIRENEIEDATFGLITEARRLLDQLGQPGRVIAVAMVIGWDSFMDIVLVSDVSLNLLNFKVIIDFGQLGVCRMFYIFFMFLFV